MIVLADTSIWIDHFRRGDLRLSRLLDSGNVIMHPFVIGELVLGHVPGIVKMMADLQDLPRAKVASEEETLKLILDRKLSGFGIGYVDAHLLAAIALMPETLLWTRDKPLHAAAQRLSFAADIRD